MPLVNLNQMLSVFVVAVVVYLITKVNFKEYSPLFAYTFIYYAVQLIKYIYKLNKIASFSAIFGRLAGM